MDNSIEVNKDEKGGTCFYTNKRMVAYTIQGNNQVLISANMMALFGNKSVTTGQGTKAQMIQTSPEHKEINKYYIAVLAENSTINDKDLKMFSNHFTWNTGFSYVEHFDFIVETYIIKKDYIDSKDFKNKEKQLKRLYKAPMSLAELEGYATGHNIPALAPTLRQAIENLN